MSLIKKLLGKADDEPLFNRKRMAIIVQDDPIDLFPDEYDDDTTDKRPPDSGTT